MKTWVAWFFFFCGCLMIGFGLGRIIERNENVGQIALLRAQMAPPGKCFYKDQTAATMCVAPDRHVRVVCNDSEGCGSIKLETLEQFDRPKAAPVASKQ